MFVCSAEEIKLFGISIPFPSLMLFPCNASLIVPLFKLFLLLLFFSLVCFRGHIKIFHLGENSVFRLCQENAFTKSRGSDAKFSDGKQTRTKKKLLQQNEI